MIHQVIYIKFGCIINYFSKLVIKIDLFIIELILIDNK